MSLQQAIENKLVETFRPLHLEVLNESFRHNVPKGSETHFKLVVVSDAFEGLRLVQRHQKVNALFMTEMKEGLHALSMETMTSGEWEERGGTVLASPPCLGGSKFG